MLCKLKKLLKKKKETSKIEKEDIYRGVKGSDWHKGGVGGTQRKDQMWEWRWWDSCHWDMTKPTEKSNQWGPHLLGGLKNSSYFCSGATNDWIIKMHTRKGQHGQYSPPLKQPQLGLGQVHVHNTWVRTLHGQQIGRLGPHADCWVVRHCTPPIMHAFSSHLYFWSN